MKFLASVLIIFAIHVISAKKFWRMRPIPFNGPQTSYAVLDQNAISNSNAIAIFAGLKGDANANSFSVASNNNQVNQLNC
jgi:hypothetical protein